MTQGDRAAVDVNFLGVNFEGLHHGKSLCGEGFVQFYQVNVIQ